ncbi:MAG TPA: helix-turn-helix domain-containing protein [Candidatus Dormibacteraeota bacterium]|nr:helix-turn-helix domain-containing protein [Candidatus Dormibacteraeota bacterium]
MRKLRAERGLSLAKVAQGDFSRAFLNQVELGKAQPSTRVLRVIAGRLGTQVDYLLEGRLPSLDRELALERARILLLRGRPRQALAALDDVTGSEWPLATDRSLARAEALKALGRDDEANAILAAERKTIRMHHDSHRLERWRAVSSGEQFTMGGKDPARAADSHLRLADRAVRSGDSRAALEHYQSARALLEL